ncbi:MAG: carbon-nitrogen hydrolase family protein [Epsilonproteobacteria bacterium]|nr:carbon-nitrogen hydrolase family protein [Campylobacterota bacterium]
MISDLVSLQFAYSKKSFKENFETLSFLVKNTPQNSIVLAPELCLSGYRYEELQKSADFSKKILPAVIKLSHKKTICLTLVLKIGEDFFNIAKIYHNQKEIYSRAKAKLFKLGNEEKYFTQGSEKDIKVVDIEGTKIALLICFELRFSKLWGKIKGADIILIPSYWGKGRKEHLKSLSIALAIMNQCFVIVSNSSDEDMASNSCIITPFGEIVQNDNLEIISKKYDKSLIEKMRRYINIAE